jgi:hypothetical protein
LALRMLPFFRAWTLAFSVLLVFLGCFGNSWFPHPPWLSYCLLLLLSLPSIFPRHLTKSTPCFCWFLACITLWPWRWRW